MAVTLVGFGGPSFEDDAADQDLALTWPAGSSSDILVALLGKDYASSIGTGWAPPDGSWIELEQLDYPTLGTTTVNGQIFARTAPDSGTGGATFTYGATSGSVLAGSVLRLSGVDLSGGLAAAIRAHDNASGSSNAPTAPSISANDGDFVLRAYLADDDDSPNDDSGCPETPIFNRDSGLGSDISIGAAHKTQSGTGATGTGAFSLDATEQWVAFTIAFKPAAAGPVEAAAALTGTASIAASGVSFGTRSAAAGLTASATLAVAPAVIRAAAADLSGSGVLIGDADVFSAPVQAAVALIGTGTIAPAGTVIRGGTVALAGSATLGAAGIRLARVAVTLDGAAELAATGAVQRNAATALGGTATLSATGTVVRGAAAALTGQATLAALAGAIRNGEILLAGTALLAAQGAVQGEVLGAAALTGTATITAAGRMVYAGTAVLGADASLTAAGSVVRAGAAGLDAAARLDAAGRVRRNAAAALAGTATLSASAETAIDAVTAAVSLTGSAALDARAVMRVAGAAALTGTAILQALPGEVARFPIRVETRRPGAAFDSPRAPETVVVARAAAVRESFRPRPAAENRRPRTALDTEAQP